ncbi:hypothetical protein [Clostridium psychrophilum]|uniref:hypothetical protein n=1 Tax=Clostridium psychrophilum TaxID=132926 RepID=UPI001C0B3792|nr:hypothetical protein [Clostridium psychrophilum]MBU3180310.1 hypothetical protein [Clostridium psychrophilum]
MLISYDDINKIYKSDILFPVFSSKLLDKKRNGIDKNFSKYGMKEYDGHFN